MRRGRLVRRGGRARRAFSLIEMQIALTISAVLLTATMVALDTMFKGYEVNADSASTHVVSRIAVNRVLTLVRTGTEFGPVSANVFDIWQNPVAADYFEFVSERDASGNPTKVTTIEYRYADHGAQRRSWGLRGTPPTLPFTPTGPGSLWLVETDLTGSAVREFMLLERVQTCLFVLRYGRGPVLERATIDLTVEPEVPEAVQLHTEQTPQTVRIVASAMPRQTTD